MKKHSIWKYNKRSGLWDHQRNVEHDTKDQWMSIYKKDEPDAHFHVSANKPKHNPLNEGEGWWDSVSAFGRQAADTATLGGYKYASAAAQYGAKNAASALGYGKGTTFKRELDQEKEKLAHDEKEHQQASSAGKLAGYGAMAVAPEVPFAGTALATGEKAAKVPYYLGLAKRAVGLEEEIANVTGDAVQTNVQFKPMRPMTRRGKFAGNETFIVPHSTFVSLRESKRRGKHWRTYLNEDDAYHDIREYARKKKGPIIVEDENTGACMYVRYGEGGAIHEAVENSIRSTERGGLSDAGKKARDVRRETKLDYGKEKYLGTFKGYRVRKTSFGQGDAAYHLEDPKTGDITHSVNGSERRGVLTVGGASSTGNSKIKMHDFYHHLIRKHIKALVGTSHSEGAKKVWQKLAKKPGVSLHGWHKGKAVNLDPQDEGETHAPAARYPIDRREPEEKEVAATKLVASYHKKGAKRLVMKRKRK